eukprot:g3767.t1
MASLTINPPPAKRLKTSGNTQDNNTLSKISLVPFIDDFINTMCDKLSPNGIHGELTPEVKNDVLERMEAIMHLKVSQQQNKRCFGDFSKLPGIDDICVKTIIPYLGNDGQALMNMFGKTTKRFLTVSTIHDVYNSNISNCYKKVLNRLNVRYKTEFPKGTPFLCACENGFLEDVKLFITCMKHINNNNMTLKDMVSQLGKNSDGDEYTPLIESIFCQHFHVAKYLIEHGEADPNIADSIGWNALHYATGRNRRDTELIQMLLTHMSLDNINMTDSEEGETPLDRIYHHNDSPIRHEIIALLRSKGGKANCYDVHGRNVGKGNGNLNVGRHAVITGSDIEVVREALTTIDDINEMNDDGQTVLDLAYCYNDSPISKQEIIALLRSKGGKANCYDVHGRHVGEGNGDLND